MDPLSLANLSRPEVLADPYALYAQIRASDPVHWDELSRCWLITRYDDVIAGLHEKRFSRSETLERYLARIPVEHQAEAGPIRKFFSSTFMYADAPHHTRLRSLINKAFTPSMVERFRPFVEKKTEALLQAVAGQSEIDFVSEAAFELPLAVISHMLGIGAENQDAFKAWTNDIVAVVGMLRYSPEIIERATKSLSALHQYMDGIIEKARSSGEENLLTALIAAADAGERLSAEELATNAILLLMAAHETTANLTVNGVLALLQNPEQMQRLRGSPEMLDRALDEMLRYDGSVQLTGRVATQDLEIGGKVIAKGQLVQLLLGAANRDPAKFADPDRFDIDRPEVRHAAFGMGLRYCLGAPLAKIETGTMIRFLLARFPKLSLAPQTIQYRASPIYRGPQALRIRLN